MKSAQQEALLTIDGLWSFIVQWWHENSQVLESVDYIPIVGVESFLTILAFSVAVFALAGPKYQLRQSIAFFPVKRLFFWTLVCTGFLTLFAEAAILHKWRLPSFLPINSLNLFLAGWISLIAIYWMRVCFLSPPRYGRMTASHFFLEAFRSIGNGTQEEMLALARELMPNFDRIIKAYPRVKEHLPPEQKQTQKVTRFEAYSYQMISLLSDVRFCELVARELPSFPAMLVERLVELKRYDTMASLVIRRMVIALISNKNSALFVENEWLAQGYFGKTKPITNSIMFNWPRFENIGRHGNSPLDLSYPYAEKWDLVTWQVYFGMAKEYLAGLRESGDQLANRQGVSEILRTMEVAYRRLGEVNESLGVSDPYSRTRIAREANEFLYSLVELADEKNEWVEFDRRNKHFYGRDLSSKIAYSLEESLFDIAKVESDSFYTVWHVQHNTFWYALQDHKLEDSKTMRMVRRKLRRMIWSEIKTMESFPNFKGAYYVRFCLFVLGFYGGSSSRGRLPQQDSWPLSKAVTHWVIRNYRSIAISNPPVAEAMLPIGFKYDSSKGVLVSERDDTLTGRVRSKVIELQPPTGTD